MVVKLSVDIEVTAGERLQAITNRIALTLRKNSSGILVVAVEHSPREYQLFISGHIQTTPLHFGISRLE